MVSDVSPLLRHRAALWFVTKLEQGDQHPRKRRECSRHKNERSKTALEGVLVQKRPNIICHRLRRSLLHGLAQKITKTIYLMPAANQVATAPQGCGGRQTEEPPALIRRLSGTTLRAPWAWLFFGGGCCAPTTGDKVRQ